jgi:bifunctional non-homologous end joining protein LigD
VYWAFDILQIEGEDIRGMSVERRFEELVALLDPSELGALRVVPNATTKWEKQNLLLRLYAERAEGVVFKHRGAPYAAGRPASGGYYLKFKFTTTATCKVLDQNKGKRSVALAVLQDPGDGYVEVGNVTIPVNVAIPASGSLIEVRYLYAYVGGSLYQPVYLRDRDDVEFPDSAKSLKYKQGESDECEEV